MFKWEKVQSLGNGNLVKEKVIIADNQEMIIIYMKKSSDALVTLKYIVDGEEIFHRGLKAKTLEDGKKEAVGVMYDYLQKNALCWLKRFNRFKEHVGDDNVSKSN